MLFSVSTLPILQHSHPTPSQTLWLWKISMRNNPFQIAFSYSLLKTFKILVNKYQKPTLATGDTNCQYLNASTRVRLSTCASMCALPNLYVCNQRTAVTFVASHFIWLKFILLTPTQSANKYVQKQNPTQHLGRGQNKGNEPGCLRMCRCDDIQTEEMLATEVAEDWEREMMEQRTKCRPDLQNVQGLQRHY
jgi:hypothetical protein